jgi:hypothetical protein
MLVTLLALAACAGKSDNDSDQHQGFYGGVSGAWN